MNKTIISHGPFIGDLTESQIKIWFRTNEEPQNNFVLRLYEKDTEVDFREITVSKEADFIGVVKFDLLKSDSQYEAVLFHKKEVLFKVSFKTKTSHKKNLHFIFGSCRYNHWENALVNDAEAGDNTFGEILKVHEKSELDFALFLGDQIYADPTYSVGICESFADFSTTYQDAFKLENFQKLLSKVPSYMILDDHEIRDNWSRDMLDSFSFFENREDIYKNGLKNYELWQHSRNPDTENGKLWYSFEQSEQPFFILDIRTQRVLNPKRNHRKTTLGDQQLGDLLDWLYSTKDKPVRFIGSGIPFCPDYNKLEDKWCAFSEERSIVLEFIRVEGIGKTVFLSGDTHIGMFSKLTCVEDNNFEVFNLVSSPLYWPYRGMYISDFYENRSLNYEQWVDKDRRRRAMFEYKYQTTDWLRENQFAEVKVDHNGLGKVRHFNMKTSKFEKWFKF